MSVADCRYFYWTFRVVLIRLNLHVNRFQILCILFLNNRMNALHFAQEMFSVNASRIQILHLSMILLYSSFHVVNFRVWVFVTQYQFIVWFIVISINLTKVSNILIQLHVSSELSFIAKYRFDFLLKMVGLCNMYFYHKIVLKTVVLYIKRRNYKLLNNADSRAHEKSI